MSAETQSIAPAAPASALKRWLPGLILLFIAIILPALYVLKQLRPSTAIVPPPGVLAVPPAPPKQPPAADAKETTAKTAIDQRFLYPGARTTMVISKAGEGDVIRLETKDSLDKVADWYVERLKPAERVIQPGNVILRTDAMAVIITSNGNGTNIMLRQGGNK